ncbi:hypothetical protein MTR67_032336 [Solanum verrucosum]|uniref:NB-ARC domain-containing protein n=1 Tax=Solanum verrucosum TaxID=315347 RepID=A0AAF0U4A8_SOLVR|nr:hypothetical protein MTR67_032336 [Solanum verrucosum]
MEVKDIEDVKVLEKRIKDVVYKAEDRIDSSLRSIILLDNGDDDRVRACKAFNEELQQVEKVVFSRKSTTEEKTVVGMKDDLNTILNCINAQTKELIVISVVGMGGIGKTTLARKVFDDSMIRSQFYKHAWVTISEDYNKRQMLLDVVSSITEINQEIMSNDKLMETVYKGSFPEDMEIRVSKLISSWIAEQFIKARSNTRLEVVAEEYLQELTDRSLILVGGRRANGRIKICKIHDLLRQMCIREAQIENVVHFTNNDISDGINDHRRVIIPYLIQDYFRDHPKDRNGKITTRSLIFLGRQSYEVTGIYYWPYSISDFKLLKVLDAHEIGFDFSRIIPQLVHLRYVDARVNDPSSLAKLFNLQTIIIYSQKKNVQLPTEIWTMSEIKHVDITDVDMPNPPLGEQPLFLNNLHTLAVKSSAVVLKILRSFPNLNKLKINDCLVKLPNLEVLKADNAFWGTDWKLDEDVVFPELKYLGVHHGNLERWEATSDNFPMLEELYLSWLHFLEEIPESIGEIMTLKSIKMRGCNSAVITSAEQIRENQEIYGAGKDDQRSSVGKSVGVVNTE